MASPTSALRSSDSWARRRRAEPKKIGGTLFACRWGLLGLVIPVDQHDLRCITGSGHAPGVGG